MVLNIKAGVSSKDTLTALKLQLLYYLNLFFYCLLYFIVSRIFLVGIDHVSSSRVASGIIRESSILLPV